MSWALVKPTSRNIASVCSAISITGSDGYPGKATEGMATSFSRSFDQLGHERGCLVRYFLRLHQLLRFSLEFT